MYQVKYSLKKILNHYLIVFLYFLPFYIISLVETNYKYKNTVIICQYISLVYIFLVIIYFLKDIIKCRNKYFIKLDSEKLQIANKTILRNNIISISLFTKIVNYTYWFSAHPEKRSYKKHFLNIHFENENQLFDLEHNFSEIEIQEIFENLQKKLNNNFLNS